MSAERDAVERCDAVVIGAGAAGLAAARELGRAGRRVVVLEARDCVGGRVRSLVDPIRGTPIELGAEFVHGRPAGTLALLAEARASEIDVTGELWQERHGRFERTERLLDAAGELLAGVAGLRDDESVETYLARFNGDPGRRDAVAWTRRLVEGFDAADPRDASVRAIAEEWAGDAGMPGGQSRPLDGYGRLFGHLVAALDPSVRLRLQTVVREIRRERGGVRVTASSHGRPLLIEAPVALVTVPVGVLQRRPPLPGAIAFDPPLPAEKRRALAAIAMGPVVKIVLALREPFWEGLDDGAYRDAAFFHAPQQPFPTLWTLYPRRAPQLVAWAGGPAAQRLAGRDDAALIGVLLDELGTLFGRAEAADAVVAAFTHDWGADPYACGAYSYVRVGGGSARRDLALPIDETLFFAGEATAEGGDSGTVGAALASGVRAAREALSVAVG